MKKLLALLLALTLCLGAVACAEELITPTDFTFDTQTGRVSFTSNDENAGYYFVRVYPVVNGREASAYVASSRRINAGRPGEKTGQVDVSVIGWGAYDVKLVTFAASGTAYTAPAPVILRAFYGVGGVLERPELMATAGGNTVEITLDRYTLSDWKKLQYLPTVRFRLYADEACTQLIDEADVETSELVLDIHPTGNYIWPYSLTTGRMNFEAAAGGPPGGGPGGGTQKYCLTPEAAFTVDAAGTYYVTAQAVSNDESRVASSQVSEALAVQLTADAPEDGVFTVVKSSLWADPQVMGMPTAGTAQGRVDSGLGQATTAIAE